MINYKKIAKIVSILIEAFRNRSKVGINQKTEDMSKVKKVTVKRVADDGETSLGVIYLDGVAFCGSVEDQEQKGAKIMHESRVSNGIYRLALREEGGYHFRYKEKYADMHEGMLCIYNDKNWNLNCPDGKSFQYILVHTGNTDDHTSGCLLPNFAIDFKAGRGSRSGDAYKELYPILRDSIKSSPFVDDLGIRYIAIEYLDVEDGK